MAATPQDLIWLALYRTFPATCQPNLLNNFQAITQPYFNQSFSHSHHATYHLNQVQGALGVSPRVRGSSGWQMLSYRTKEYDKEFPNVCHVLLLNTVAMI